MSFVAQLQDTGNVVSAGGAALILAELVMYARGRPSLSMTGTAYACLAAGDVLYGIADVIQAHWADAALSFALAVLFAWVSWQRRRKDRRRAPGLAGYKARAALAKLLQRAREAAQPRPIRHPVPQGAAA